MFHESCSRRRFVAASAVALVLGPSHVVGAVARPRSLDVTDADELRRDLGSVVRIEGDEGAIDAYLVGVTEERASGPYRTFALHLESDDFLAQGVHRVRREGGAESALLVVPTVHPADDPRAPSPRRGTYAYEITFVRDVRA